jgi:hypothetical protein
MNMPLIELPKDLAHINWGTMMPVTLLIGGKITSLRARGTCSLAVNNFQLFKENSLDMDALRAQIRSYFSLRVADVLAEVSIGKTSLAGMIADKAGMENMLLSKANGDLASFGLVVQQLVIEAVESI